MKTKKTIAGILACAMVASVMSVGSVFAAGDIGVTVDKAEAKAGETFTLNVSLSGVPSTGLNAVDFAVTYDSAIVDITGVTAGAAAKTGAADDSAEAPVFGCDFSQAGVINTTWTTASTSASDVISKDGVYMVITGTVKSSAKAGDVCAFKIGSVDRETFENSGTANADVLFAFLNDAGDVTEYTTTLTSGSVTVLGEAATTTTNGGGGSTGETTTTVTTHGGGSTSVLYGDVNCDGLVDLSDAVVLAKALAKQITLTTAMSANAEVSGDGIITDDDLALLLKFVVSLISTFPAAAQ